MLCHINPFLSSNPQLTKTMKKQKEELKTLKDCVNNIQDFGIRCLIFITCLICFIFISFGFQSDYDYQGNKIIVESPDEFTAEDYSLNAKILESSIKSPEKCICSDGGYLKICGNEMIKKYENDKFIQDYLNYSCEKAVSGK